MNDFMIKIVSSCCFLGYIPFASGTFGTLAGVLMVWITYSVVNINFLQGKLIYLLICILLTALAIPISTRAEILYNKKDSSKIVIDEAVSFFITMFWLPFNIKIIIIGFVLNRILDIIKIEPAKLCQNKLRAGWGVVLDDTISAVYSNILLRTIIFLTGNFVFS